MNYLPLIINDLITLQTDFSGSQYEDEPTSPNTGRPTHSAPADGRPNPNPNRMKPLPVNLIFDMRYENEILIFSIIAINFNFI